MPLYDCVFLLKPNLTKEALADLVAQVGKHVYRKNGVITDIKSFGTVQLGYGVKKLNGRHYQGKMIQMTMMVAPSFHTELHYLNKEDRLLRWLLVKHRGVKFGLDILNELDDKRELGKNKTVPDDDDGDDDEDEDDDYDNVIE